MNGGSCVLVRMPLEPKGLEENGSVREGKGVAEVASTYEDSSILNVFDDIGEKHFAVFLGGDGRVHGDDSIWDLTVRKCISELFAGLGKLEIRACAQSIHKKLVSVIHVALFEKRQNHDGLTSPNKFCQRWSRRHRKHRPYLGCCRHFLRFGLSA